MPTSQELTEEVVQIKNQRKVARIKFTRKVNILREGIDQGNPPAVLRSSFVQVSDAYSELESVHSKYVACLCNSQASDSELEAADNYITELERKKTELHIQLENHLVRTDDTVKVKVKRLEPPTFNGDIREYPNFKADYERLMVHNYGSDPFALKQCLSGEALMTVKGAEDDFKLMFKRLDEKYGNARKIVDVVITDLKSLKPVAEGDNKSFVKLVDKIERCWLDLKKLKLESEMDTTNVVSLIEKVLPSTQKREWVLKSDESGHQTNSFKHLMDFLLKEKRVLEYMDSTVRSGAHCKASVNSVVLEANSDVAASNPVINAIERLQTNQTHIEQCLVNLTEAVSGISINRRDANVKGRNDYPEKCWYHGSQGHSILECTTFRKLNNSEKMEFLRKNGICYNCLRGKHIAKNCMLKRTCNTVQNDQRCGKSHHPSLHDAHVEGVMFHNTVVTQLNTVSRTKALLMVSSVRSKGKSLNVLWDPGSDMTLITHETASKLGLSGKNVSLNVTKVGNKTDSYNSKEYIIPLTDKEGNTWNIVAYGLSEITSTLPNIDVSEISHLMDDVSIDEIARPVGAVDILVGTDCCSLLPQVVKTIGNLQLMKNQFGYCIRGTHPSVTGNSSLANNACIRVNHLAGSTYPNDIVIEQKDSLKQSLDRFFEVETLSAPTQCKECRDVVNMSNPGNYTIREQKELELIEKGLHYDHTNKQWTAEYPWIKDPTKLPNNLPVAIARMKSTEKRLSKLGSGYAKIYQDQMKDMMDRQVARKIPLNELTSYKGPVHYIHHHEVFKPDSKSTPVRIVFNSSASYMGHVLNDYWAKGPDVLNDMLAVLLRFRQEYIAIVGDISKMYNTIKLGLVEQHTHRFLWRDLKLNEKPEHYALTAVTFGDRPSGIIAMLALRHTAEMSKIDFPEAANMIIRNTYVDDVVQSVASKSEACHMIRGAEEILAKGGFRIKHWIMSGRDDECSGINILTTDSEKILGLAWDPKNDQFKFKVKVNFSPKIKKVHTGPNLSKDEVVAKVPELLTKRVVLSQVASIFDPLGLLTPFTLRAKVLMRELVTREIVTDSKKQVYSWDEPIPCDLREKWTAFFFDLYGLESLTFNRCLKPQNSVGNPILIIYSDGSSLAYGACAYVRWELSSGKFAANLIASKNRIAPIRQMTIPRIELCGAVISCRLREKIQKDFDWKFAAVFHILDSAIVRAQIQKESYGFKTFVGNRIAEIQTKSDPCEWWWVPSECNPADILTRPNHPSTLDSESVWQQGPKYLSQPVTSWPISQFCDDDLPDRTGVVMNCNSIQQAVKDNLDMINVESYSSYNKLIRVTSRVLAAIRSKSFKSISKPLTASLIKDAEEIWVKEVQKSLPLDWEVKYQRLGPAINSQGIITVGQRIAKWLKDNWDKECYILLPANHPFTRLYIKHLHNIDHAGTEVTLAKAQAKYWIPGVRKLIKSVKSTCVKCRRLNSKVESQRMGQVISERLQPSPPFHHIGIDLFGPFKIRDTVKRRTTGKAYGVIFNCLVSRAVYIDLTDGYGTQHFLATFRRFVSLRGYPGTVHSDNGPQLVSANKELRAMMSKWNVNEIMNFGSSEGMTWLFNKSADAPWQNGCSESLIKLVKRSLCMLIGESSLTYSELQTVLFEVANLLNERPIGMKPGTDIDLGKYLCPNDLLLGRATSKAPSGPWTDCTNTRNRLEFLDKIVSGFWRKWQRDYFPSLIVRQKWHVKTRNVKQGDIVLVQCPNSIQGQWKLAQVVVADPGRDGQVRDVTIRYKSLKPGLTYRGQDYTEIKRSVHRLIVLLPVEEQ